MGLGEGLEVEMGMMIYHTALITQPASGSNDAMRIFSLVENFANEARARGPSTKPRPKEAITKERGKHQCSFKPIKNYLTSA